MMPVILLISAVCAGEPPHDDASATVQEAQAVNADLDALLARIKVAQTPHEACACPLPPVFPLVPLVAVPAEASTLALVGITTPAAEPCIVPVPCARAASPAPVPLFPLGPVEAP